MFIKGFDQKLVYVLREADISPLGFVVSSNSAQEILCLNTDSLQLVRTTHTKTSFDSLCSPQLIMEDQGLSRLAQTIQLLVSPADGSQRAPKQETSGAHGSAQGQ
ncbi:hypothetical protein F2P81_001441 [Scophthalmus maximus]|uniref:Uncharacterized protein n=1 Tax=Scophthalmus maximus TaxID=52904 RepID=A0A6A4TS87_SCOMX|nr:hypothetical protein F2P81_001441 [Scophthalmus maximus]